MSIRRKMILLLVISLVAILVVDMVLIYSRARSSLRELHETQLILTTRQAAVTVEQTRSSAAYAERELEESLRRAAETAAVELGTDWRTVTVEQLADLSRRTGVSGFSLLHRKNNELLTELSTDPQRIGSPVHESYDSVDSLPDPLKPGGVQTSGAFWADFTPSGSGKSMEEKAGFYYDGESDYVIQVFLRPQDADNELNQLGIPAVVAKLKQEDPNILEITGFSLPAEQETSGQSANESTRQLTGQAANPSDGESTRPALRQNANSDARSLLLFGTYRLTDNQAEEQIRKAAATGQGQVDNLMLNGQQYLQSYVPISQTAGSPYVLRIVYSYEPLSAGIKRQMVQHLLVFLSVALLMLMVVYFTSRVLMQPLRHILVKVRRMSEGHFETRLNMKSRDELGVLAKHINNMAENLGEYTLELEKMNDENRTMREYLESVINQTADAIHLTDSEWRVIRVNEAFERLYGWTSEELVGEELLFVPSCVWEEWEEWRRQLAEGHALQGVDTIRLCKDGRDVEVSITHSPIFNSNREVIAYITISRDMTEHNKMQELLRQSEKLTTVGQLAAGVAHEIRNPLTTLRGFLQLQQQTQSMNDQHVEIMLSELDRINLIVSEFLILAKPQASIFQDRDIRFVLGDVISLLDSQAHLHGIEFAIDFGKDPVYVHCEENQLKQVFINLLKNAMEAMPNGGGIGLKIMIENDQALVGIIDEGEGIPYERIAKLGEPFYTSKEKGTGLGLMVSQRIIEAHKGSISINSMVGWGTMVTITLPLVNRDTDGDEHPDFGEAGGKDQEE